MWDPVKTITTLFLVVSLAESTAKIWLYSALTSCPSFGFKKLPTNRRQCHAETSSHLRPATSDQQKADKIAARTMWRSTGPDRVLFTQYEWIVGEEVWGWGNSSEWSYQVSSSGSIRSRTAFQDGLVFSLSVKRPILSPSSALATHFTLAGKKTQQISGEGRGEESCSLFPTCLSALLLCLRNLTWIPGFFPWASAMLSLQESCSLWSREAPLVSGGTPQVCVWSQLHTALWWAVQPCARIEGQPFAQSNGNARSKLLLSPRCGLGLFSPMLLYLDVG